MSGSRKLFWNKFHVVGPGQRRCDGRTYRAETVAGGTKMLSFSNLSDRCTQLRQIIRCLAMQALVHRHPKLVRNSICHIEKMQLRVKQVCQAAVVLLRAAHNSRCSIHDPLRLVGNRLWCSGQQQIAIVDPGRIKQRREPVWLPIRRRVIGELVEAVVASRRTPN